MRRVRLVSLGWDSTPAGPCGSMTLRWRTVPLAPGISTPCVVCMSASSPGILRGGAMFETDDGVLLKVSFSMLALSHKDFDETRAAVMDAAAAQGQQQQQQQLQQVELENTAATPEPPFFRSDYSNVAAPTPFQTHDSNSNSNAEIKASTQNQQREHATVTGTGAQEDVRECPLLPLERVALRFLEIAAAWDGEYARQGPVNPVADASLYNEPNPTLSDLPGALRRAGSVRMPVHGAFVDSVFDREGGGPSAALYSNPDLAARLAEIGSKSVAAPSRHTPPFVASPITSSSSTTRVASKDRAYSASGGGRGRLSPTPPSQSQRRVDTPPSPFPGGDNGGGGRNSPQAPPSGGNFLPVIPSRFLPTTTTTTTPGSSFPAADSVEQTSLHSLSSSASSSSSTLGGEKDAAPLPDLLDTMRTSSHALNALGHRGAVLDFSSSLLLREAQGEGSGSSPTTEILALASNHGTTPGELLTATLVRQQQQQRRSALTDIKRQENLPTVSSYCSDTPSGGNDTPSGAGLENLQIKVNASIGGGAGGLARRKDSASAVVGVAMAPLEGIVIDGRPIIPELHNIERIPYPESMAHTARATLALQQPPSAREQLLLVNPPLVSPTSSSSSTGTVYEGPFADPAGGGGMGIMAFVPSSPGWGGGGGGRGASESGGGWADASPHTSALERLVMKGASLCTPGTKGRDFFLMPHGGTHPMLVPIS